MFAVRLHSSAIACTAGVSLVGMASLCNVELRLGLCEKADDEAELSEVDTVSGVKVHYVNNGLKVAPSNRERALLCENDNEGEVACCVPRRLDRRRTALLRESMFAGYFGSCTLRRQAVAYAQSEHPAATHQRWCPGPTNPAASSNAEAPRASFLSSMSAAAPC
jgi:hypothetical protein